MIDITTDLRFNELMELGGRPVLVFGDCDGEGVVKLALTPDDISHIENALQDKKGA